MTRAPAAALAIIHSKIDVKELKVVFASRHLTAVRALDLSGLGEPDDFSLLPGRSEGESWLVCWTARRSFACGGSARRPRARSRRRH